MTRARTAGLNQRQLLAEQVQKDTHLLVQRQACPRYHSDRLRVSGCPTAAARSSFINWFDELRAKVATKR